MIFLKLQDIISGIIKGDRRSVSRAISIVENEQLSDNAKRIVKDIYSYTGKAHIVGITGPPGIGKSTLIGNLSAMLSEQGRKVSVVAIDASSPFTGGSLLGNRIRMQESLTKYGVFMRSLANRGLKGGLSRSVWDTVKILDASGSDLIIVETVGAGQADLDVANLADTVIMVLGPGLGDEIQAIKAGIMEIGQIFVVNKMDLSGAFIAMKDLQETLAMSVEKEWNPPVVGINSLTREGYDEFISEIDRHGKFVREHNNILLRKFKTELELTINDELKIRFQKEISQFLNDREKLQALFEKKIDPYSAAENLINRIA